MGRPQTISNDEMLAAAREVFLKDRTAGSTREIAKRAGISEAALFKRFSTKAQLFMAAMAPPAPAIDAVITAAKQMTSSRRGIEKVSEAILDYFRTAIPMILPLVAHPTFGAANLPRNFETSPATSLLNALTHYLRDENARGRISASDPFASAALLVSALHSIALFEIMGFHGGAMPKAGVRVLIAALWDGLEPKSPTPKHPRKTK